MLVIQGQLDGLNDYTRANRANKYAGAKMKRESEELITLYIRAQRIPKYSGAVRIAFRWYEPNRRRDLDNICFAKKFILDALVKNEIIKSDNWKGVTGFTDEFFVDNENPRVEVEIYEI